VFPRVEMVRREFCTEIATEVLKEYSRGRSLTPPINIELVAAALGFQVISLYAVGDEFSGMVSTRQKLIGVNGRHHHHRRRFTIAHELAHILLNHPPESSCTSRQIALYNTEADACAAELLMPTAIFGQRRFAAKSLANLAYDFDVSEEAIRVRLRGTGLEKED
jgi:Zn-dependent peptidase ImmA (M78 family)